MSSSRPEREERGETEEREVEEREQKDRQRKKKEDQYIGKSKKNKNAY